MTEANKFLDSLKDGYDEVELHEMISVPKIRLQGIMQEYADKQFAIQLVSHQRELLSWMKENHHLGKTEEQINELLLDYNFSQLNCG